MVTSIELLRQGRTEELWQRYLGYLDLTTEEFMSIQKRKVMEHLAWFHNSSLGRQIIGSQLPASVDEFRSNVPMTKYSDYAASLVDRKSDALPEEPLFWCCTSGRSGEYSKKWSPVFKDAFESAAHKHAVALFALSSCRYKGDFRLEAGDRMPYTWAPPPYSLAYLAKALIAEIPMEVMPCEAEAEALSFQDRIEAALQSSFRDGMDFFYGLSSVLVKVGERFADQSGEKRQLNRKMLHPKVLFRFVRAALKAKLAGRPMYPKDLWKLKGICAGGTDTSVFSDRIFNYWGVRPVEMYGSAEFMGIAFQTWDRNGLSPLPDVAFFEFIPYDEHLKSREDPTYTPKTVLLDEVEPGQTYEIVLTSMKLSVFTRYRIGDLVRVIAKENKSLGIKFPQFVVEGRWDDVIDLAGFTRLTERTIWYAIENSGVGYEEWTCQKELHNNEPMLHIWIELKKDDRSPEAVKQAIHQSLKKMDSDYRDFEEMLGYCPLIVDLLSPGTFYRYMLNRQAAGAEPAHFKPRHFIRSDDTLNLLLEMDEKGR